MSKEDLKKFLDDYFLNNSFKDQGSAQVEVSLFEAETCFQFGVILKPSGESSEKYDLEKLQLGYLTKLGWNKFFLKGKMQGYTPYPE